MARNLVMMAMIAMMTMILVLTAAPRGSAAITCSQVNSELIPCVGYLRGGALNPRCCSGIKSLVAAAQTTQDRRMACRCIKTAAASMGIGLGKAGQLPGKCGVTVPFKIGPNTDCSKIN
ncbi:non-specific lipid-transfer protein 1-like [Canna indica]|uniref:Non-specific lipid-transfer protein n=1 Tax=Canna indica TaxID=4628 RepID=A0AAQ3L0R5_9LILI|nr:non-specific lipid-transfer protein 1-like [Canna indica]